MLKFIIFNIFYLIEMDKIKTFYEKYKKINNIIIFLLIIILILFFYKLYLYYNKQKDYLIFKELLEKQTNEIRYHRCDEKELSFIIKKISKNLNWKKDNKNWNLYIPCGYNNVEMELKSINIPENKKELKYIFGISGCDQFVSKNGLWNIINKKYGRKECKKYLPESWLFENKNEMENFMNIYDSNQIYIIKKNIQRKLGIKLTKDIRDILDSENDNFKVIQKYIKDIYLINDYKTNLRIYLLIKQTIYKKEFYLYQEGKCIYTNKKYDDNDLSFESNITSYNLDLNIYKKNPRSFNDLNIYLKKNNKDYNYLWSNINNLMKKICKGLSDVIYIPNYNKKELVTQFQLFGCDIIFNNELHPYLLEINKGPDMNPKDDIDENMKTKLQLDMFKKVGLLKDNDENNNLFYLI